MSPIGDSFRRRCRLFPSLVNNLTIDWFDNWPTEALLSFANKSIDILEQSENSDIVKNLPNVCNKMHEIVMHYTHRFYEQIKRYNYVTPKSFLEFLKFYVKTHEIQINKIKNKSNRISNGLQKLYETFDMVGEMKTKLKQMAPALLEKNEVTSKLTVTLTKEKASVDKVREIVMTEEAAAKLKASAAQEIAEDAQRDLTLAMPAMEAAIKALESLNKNDINELRVFNKPPKLVQIVMEAVCLLLAKK
jgi:dynein heavy chain